MLCRINIELRSKGRERRLLGVSTLYISSMFRAWSLISEAVELYNQLNVDIKRFYSQLYNKFTSKQTNKHLHAIIIWN